MPTCIKMKIKLRPKTAKNLLTKSKPSNSDHVSSNSTAPEEPHASESTSLKNAERSVDTEQGKSSTATIDKTRKRDRVKAIFKKLFKGNKKTVSGCPLTPSTSTVGISSERVVTASESDEATLVVEDGEVEQALGIQNVERESVADVQSFPTDQELETQDNAYESVATFQISPAVSRLLQRSLHAIYPRQDVISQSTAFTDLPLDFYFPALAVRPSRQRRGHRRAVQTSISVANEAFASQDTSSSLQTGLASSISLTDDLNPASDPAASTPPIHAAVTALPPTADTPLLVTDATVDEEFETISFDLAEAWLDYWDAYILTYNLLYVRNKVVIGLYGKTYLITRRDESASGGRPEVYYTRLLRKKPIFRAYKALSLEELVSVFRPRPWNTWMITAAAHEDEVEEFESNDVQEKEDANEASSPDSSRVGSRSSSPIEHTTRDTTQEPEYTSIEECKNDHETAMKMAETNHVNELEDLKDDHEAAIKELKKEHEATIKALKKEHTSSRKVFGKEVLVERKAVKQLNDEKISRLQSEIGELTNALTTTETQRRLTQESCAVLQNKVAGLINQTLQLNAELGSVRILNQEWRVMYDTKLIPKIERANRKYAELQQEYGTLHGSYTELESTVQEQGDVIVALTRDLDVKYHDDDVDQEHPAFSSAIDAKKDLEQQLDLMRKNCEERGEQIAALQEDLRACEETSKAVCLQKGLLEIKLKEVKAAISSSEEFRTAIWKASSGGALLPEGMDALLAREAEISDMLQTQASKIGELESDVMLFARARRQVKEELKEKHAGLEAAQAKVMSLEGHLEACKASCDEWQAANQVLQKDVEAWQKQCERQTFGTNAEVLRGEAEQVKADLISQINTLQKIVVKQDDAVYKAHEDASTTQYCMYLLQTMPEDLSLTMGDEHQAMLQAKFDHRFKWSAVPNYKGQLPVELVDAESKIRELQMYYAISNFNATGDLNDEVMTGCLERALEELKETFPFLNNFTCTANIERKPQGTGKEPIYPLEKLDLDLDDEAIRRPVHGRPKYATDTEGCLVDYVDEIEEDAPHAGPSNWVENYEELKFRQKCEVGKPRGKHCKAHKQEGDD